MHYFLCKECDLWLSSLHTDKYSNIKTEIIMGFCVFFCNLIFVKDLWWMYKEKNNNNKQKYVENGY